MHRGYAIGEWRWKRRELWSRGNGSGAARNKRTTDATCTRCPPFDSPSARERNAGGSDWEEGDGEGEVAAGCNAMLSTSMAVLVSTPSVLDGLCVLEAEETPLAFEIAA